MTKLLSHIGMYKGKTTGPMPTKSQTNANGSDQVPDAVEKSAESSIKESVDAATERVDAATKRLAVEIDKLVSEGVKTVQSAASEYAVKLGENAEVAAEQAKKAYSEGQEYVKENPVPSVLGAFAVGLLLGALLRRS